MSEFSPDESDAGDYTHDEFREALHQLDPHGYLWGEVTEYDEGKALYDVGVRMDYNPFTDETDRIYEDEEMRDKMQTLERRLGEALRAVAALQRAREAVNTRSKEIIGKEVRAHHDAGLIDRAQNRLKDVTTVDDLFPSSEGQ